MRNLSARDRVVVSARATDAVGSAVRAAWGSGVRGLDHSLFPAPFSFQAEDGCSDDVRNRNFDCGFHAENSSYPYLVHPRRRCIGQSVYHEEC